MQLVRDEGDELGVRGLALGVGHGVAEEALERFQIAAIPRDLDGVADGALHARGRGGKRLGDLRIQNLGDGIDDIHIVHGDHDRLAQVLIALDVRRNADLVDDGRDHRLHVDLRALLRRELHLPVELDDLGQMVCHRLKIARLRHEILHAELCRAHADVLRHVAAEDERQRRLFQLLRPAEDRKPVQPRQHQVEHQHVRVLALQKLHRRLAVVRHARDVKCAALLERAAQVFTKFFVAVGNQDLNTIFHISKPLLNVIIGIFCKIYWNDRCDTHNIA